jgi:hypothetical protein
VFTVSFVHGAVSDTIWSGREWVSTLAAVFSPIPGQYEEASLSFVAGHRYTVVPEESTIAA